jgi:hypothetical protein
MAGTREDDVRYGTALDLIGELLSSPTRPDWVSLARLWMRKSPPDRDGPVYADGFADILGAARGEEERVLVGQVAACGLAVSIARYWSSVSASGYRQGLETLIDGLDALLKLSAAFEAKSRRYVLDGLETARDMTLWRVIATMTETEVERRLLAKSLPPDPSPFDADGERISSGSLRRFLAGTRHDPEVRRIAMRLSAKDMARVAGAGDPITPHAIIAEATIPALGLSGIRGLETLRELLLAQWRCTEGLDPRFRLFPKPAMVAAVAGLCLKDAWLPAKSLSVQIHDKAPQIAGLLYRMVGETHEPDEEAPDVKDQATWTSMERSARAARTVYMRLRRNPLRAPGREDAWELRSATPSSS